MRFREGGRDLECRVWLPSKTDTYDDTPSSSMYFVAFSGTPSYTQRLLRTYMVECRVCVL